MDPFRTHFGLFFRLLATVLTILRGKVATSGTRLRNAVYMGSGGGPGRSGHGRRIAAPRATHARRRGDGSSTVRIAARLPTSPTPLPNDDATAPKAQKGIAADGTPLGERDGREQEKDEAAGRVILRLFGILLCSLMRSTSSCLWC